MFWAPPISLLESLSETSLVFPLRPLITGSRFVPSLFMERSICVQLAKALPTLMSWLKIGEDLKPNPISVRISL